MNSAKLKFYTVEVSMDLLETVVEPFVSIDHSLGATGLDFESYESVFDLLL
jgi:hypothetical protein